MADSVLVDYFRQYSRWFILTGAGISTASGIPHYRDRNGQWMHSQPIQFQAFVNQQSVYKRYWARSAIGWKSFQKARFNQSHRLLAQLESMDKISIIVTQNVDGLHQKAGSTSAINLHGNLDHARCLSCDTLHPRESIQDQIMSDNPALNLINARPLPDGDAWLVDFDFDNFHPPACHLCDGRLKPDVVFFGENVPRQRVDTCFSHLASSDALMIIGSSLMVYSGLRFVRAAHDRGLPIVAINDGITRADDLLDYKVESDCADTLLELITELCDD
ncbi:MAG: NAD-dependent SIR2 family protein deacetylase [Gammaproteobacteria bacterium]|jgi:NAD-dependent SIR2 family protein deacetylase